VQVVTAAGARAEHRLIEPAVSMREHAQDRREHAQDRRHRREQHDGHSAEGQARRRS